LLEEKRHKLTRSSGEEQIHSYKPRSPAALERELSSWIKDHQLIETTLAKFAKPALLES
jgi:hypothetical protein